MVTYISWISLLFIYAIIVELPPIWGPLCLEISSTLLLIILKVKLELIEHTVYTMEMSTQTCDINNINEMLTNSHISNSNSINISLINTNVKEDTVNGNYNSLSQIQEVAV